MLDAFVTSFVVSIFRYPNNAGPKSNKERKLLNIKYLYFTYIVGEVAEWLKATVC